VLTLAMRRIALAAVVLVSASATPASARLAYEKFAGGGGGPRGVYVARDDGSQPRLVVKRGFAPYLSPRGRWIAYFGKAGNGLHVVGLHGLQHRLVLRRAYDARAGSPLAWSPDERRIMAASLRGKDEGGWLVDRRTRTASALAGEGYGGASFAPHGARAAVSDDAGKSSKVTIFRADSMSRVSGFAGTSPVWGPRGLAFTRFVSPSPVDPGGQRIVLRAGGRTRSLLKQRGTLYPVAWSQDGRVLLVSAQDGPEDPVHALLLRPGSGRTTRVPGALGGIWDLSSDGRHVLAGYGPSVVSVKADGHMRILVPNGTHATWTK
jgi:Tol biopolymer transport system component